MADDDLEIDLDDIQRRMEGALASLRAEFASLRTGRASATMLEPLMIDAYGARTPISQVGTINVPEPRMLTLTVWDKGLMGIVEKAIRESGLGINPVIDGVYIRVAGSPADHFTPVGPMPDDMARIWLPFATERPAKPD